MVWAPARRNADTMSTRCPAHVNRTGVVTAPRLAWVPAARGPLIGALKERERRPREDLQVDPERPVLDVPDVELDALVPGQRGSAVHPRAAGGPGAHHAPEARPRR